MNKKKAIAILKRQREKIATLRTPETVGWVFQTTSFIKIFFGENSHEHFFIGHFEFEVTALNISSEQTIRAMQDERRISAENFIDNCIETIQLNGLYKKPNTSFLTRWSNWQIMASIIAMVGSIGSVGYWIGINKVDRDKLKTEIKLDSILKSLPLHNHTNNVPKADTTKNTN